MFDPFNLNKQNPFEGIELNSICYFDTETTGLHPVQSQIVEIAAVLGDAKFYKKIELTQETLQQIASQKEAFEKKSKKDKTVEELLQMSNYHEGDHEKCSEEDALKQFVQFVKSAKILLAHNASFDMRMVNVRCKKYGIEPIKDIPIYDSLAFSRRFFVPSLITIEKTSKNSQSRQKAKDILDKITKQYYKSGQRMNVSNTLSSLVGALRGQIGNWHQAMADVEMLKDLIENFFKLMFDKHFKEDFEQDIRSKQTFKQYYMRNVRFEDRMKQSDKKKAR
jgi:DNA polymerase III epsilon subunit-like protein